ncbi:hypothetical protein [Brachybacterium huguangmaarense]
MATNYTSDGTYWTGRIRDNGYLEVVRLKSGNYGYVESWGSYEKHGSAVAAAAQLAYAQGREDAQAELQTKLLGALASAGLGPIAVEQPDISPEDQVDEDEAIDPDA